jgi:hypothetical protein
VLFAGAATTTESYDRTTFLEHIKDKCKYPKKLKNQFFPDVMQYYCQTFDSGGKNKLIREIIEWIEFFCVPGEPNRFAIRFFEEIARIPFFRIIVTTNWDPLCERTINVLIPMVEDRDIPFWDENRRQVLKIHACVTRPHTIVATAGDYDACMKDKSRGAIFTKLRDLMATKTFIFIGYSIQDPDFQLIYDEVINNLGPFRRGAYAIDPQPKEDSVKNWEARGVKILKISSLAFAWDLTTYLEKHKLILSQKLIDHFENQLRRIIRIHFRTADKQELPRAFSSMMYQDGLIHSLEHSIESSKIGTLMQDFAKQLKEYEETLNKLFRIISNKRKCKAIKSDKKEWKPSKRDYAYVEFAYWSGRVEALKYFVSSNRSNIPAFFSPYSLKPINRWARIDKRYH